MTPFSQVPSFRACISHYRTQPPLPGEGFRRSLLDRSLFQCSASGLRRRPRRWRERTVVGQRAPPTNCVWTVAGVWCFLSILNPFRIPLCPLRPALSQKFFLVARFSRNRTVPLSSVRLWSSLGDAVSYLPSVGSRLFKRRHMRPIRLGRFFSGVRPPATTL